MRAVDNFLNPLCHVFGGSALIDEPLSAYRVHGSNYYSQREVLPGVQSGSAESMRRTRENSIETLDVFLEKAAAFSPILQDRFWPAFDQLSSDLRGPDGPLLPEPGLLTMLSDNYEITAGDLRRGRCRTRTSVQAHLTGFLRRDPSWTWRDTASWSVLMHQESPVRLQFDRAGRILRRYRETPVKAAPRVFALDIKNTLGRLRQSSPPERDRALTVGAPTCTDGSGHAHGRLRGAIELRPCSTHFGRSSRLPVRHRLRGAHRHRTGLWPAVTAMCRLRSCSIQRGRSAAHRERPP